jgi:hypothetical protein
MAVPVMIFRMPGTTRSTRPPVSDAMTFSISSFLTVDPSVLIALMVIFLDEVKRRRVY